MNESKITRRNWSRVDEYVVSRRETWSISVLRTWWLTRDKACEVIKSKNSS